MKERICRWLARHEFAVLGRRENPIWSTRFHGVLENDLATLRELLSEFARERPWTETRELYRYVAEAGHTVALPTSEIPTFVAVDFECHPSTGEPWEFGVAASMGLFWDTFQDRGFVENSKGLPITQPEPRGAQITRAQCRRGLEKSFAGPNVVVVGHNIKRFDRKVLEALGIEASEISFLDTLELSLLTNPFQRSHRLGGAHRALDDARQTISLLNTLDHVLMQADLDEINVLQQLAKSDKGLQQYLGYVLFRRGGASAGKVDVQSSIRRLRAARWAHPLEAGVEVPPGPSLEPKAGNLSPFLTIEQGAIAKDAVIDISEPLLPEDFIRNDHIAGTRYLVSEQRLRGWLPRFDRRDHGLNGRVLAISNLNRFLSPELVGSLINGRGPLQVSDFQRLYLAAWAAKTRFHLISEIHPFLLVDSAPFRFLVENSGEDNPPEDIRERVESYVRTIPCLVSDSVGVLARAAGRRTIVCDSLDPEENLECHLDVDLDVGTLCSFPGAKPQLAEWAKSLKGFLLEFCRNRDIDSLVHSRQNLRCLLSPRDIRDPLFQEIRACLANLESTIKEEVPIGPLWRNMHAQISSLRTALLELANPVASAATGVVFYGDPREAGRVGIRLYRFTPFGSVLDVLKKQSPGVQVLTEGVRRCGLTRWYETLRGVQLAPSAAGEVAGTIEVVPEGAVPGPKSVRSLITVKIHAAIQVRKEAAAGCFVVGTDRDNNHLCALIERRFDSLAFDQGWYGSTSATTARIQGESKDFTFYGSSHALSGFDSIEGQTAVISQLPFPGMGSPLTGRVIQHDQKKGSNPFEAMLLPVMALRLNRLLSEIRRKGANQKVIATDPRFLDRQFYRSLIARACGAVRLGERASWLEKGPSRQTISEEVGRELEKRGIGARRSFSRDEVNRAFNFIIGQSGRHLKNKQLEAVEAILDGKNVLAVLPTGFGKSVCYQIPALLMGEAAGSLTVIISPLRALTRNQVAELSKSGYPCATYLDGDLPSEERWARLRGLRMGWYNILYIAPEQLRARSVRNVLLERGVDYFFVDEAHCMSEWGHEFRPDYLHIPSFLNSLAERGHKPPTIGAFTATATTECANEIKAALGIKEEVRVPAVREEISCAITHVAEGRGEAFSLEPERRWAQILAFLERHAGETGIIFVHRRQDVDSIANKLRENPPKGWASAQIGAYHAQLPNRREVEQSFLGNDGPGGLKLIVSTIAFGMGINKDDIRFIIHHSAPTTVEDYYQQVGRGARGPGQRAEALCFFDEQEWEWKAGLGEPVTAVHCERMWRALLGKVSEKESAVFLSLVQAEALLGLPVEIIRHCLHLLEVAGAIRIRAAANRERTQYRMCGKPLKPSLSELQSEIMGQFSEGVLLSEQEVWAGVNITALAFDLDRNQFQDSLEQLCRAPNPLLEVVRDSHLRFAAKPEQVQQWITGHYSSQERLLGAIDHVAPELRAGRVVRLEGQKLCDLLQKSGLGFSEVGRIFADWAISGEVDLWQGFLSFTVKARSDSFQRDALSTLREQDTQLVAEMLAKPRSEDETIHISTADERLLAHKLVMAELAVLTQNQEEGFGFEVEVLRPDFMPQRDITSATYDNYWRNKELRQACMKEMLNTCTTGAEVIRYINQYFSDDQLARMRKQQEQALRGTLNDQQWRAVEDRSDFLLINAAAGTGKTHTLASRVLHLRIKECLPLRKILVLTFSVSGMKQIRDRILELSAKHCGSSLFPPVMTFHAFSLRLIRVLGSSGESWVDPSAPPISPVKYKKSDDFWTDVNPILLEHRARILGDVGGKLDSDKKLELFSTALDAIRNGNVDLPEIVLNPEDCPGEGEVRIPDAWGELTPLPLGDVKKVFSRYYEVMRQQRRVDFAGMVSEAIMALESGKESLDRICDGVDHILVDEFQDTSRAQERLIRALQARGQALGRFIRLDVVGDSDQTIFSFNGSSVENILQFAERNISRFSGRTTTRIDLTANYRSAKPIIDLANHCIRFNTHRLEKNMVAQRKGAPDTVPVSLVETFSLEEAASCTAERIQALLSDPNIAPSQIAVIARKNSKTYPMLELVRKALVAAGSPEYASRRTRKTPVGATDKLFEFLRGRSTESLGVIVGELLGKDRSAEESRWLFLLEGLEADGVDSVEQAIVIVSRVGDNSDGNNGIHFLTAHGAKGLEFSYVFILYLGDKTFPDSRSEAEEERRLLYVGITRARDSLTIMGKLGGVPDFYEELAGAPPAILARSVCTGAGEGRSEFKIEGPAGPPPHLDDDVFKPNSIDDILDHN